MVVLTHQNICVEKMIESYQTGPKLIAIPITYQTTICQFLREMISKLTVASGNIKKEHLEDKWNLQFFFTGSTVMEMKEKKEFFLLLCSIPSDFRMANDHPFIVRPLRLSNGRNFICN